MSLVGGTIPSEGERHEKIRPGTVSERIRVDVMQKGQVVRQRIAVKNTYVK